jgi:hypothetical protein
LSDLSRTISHALRHDPAAYGLQLDAEGWAQLDDLIAALRRVKPGWGALDRDDLAQMMAIATKQRHEIVGDRIRAVYGHSVPRRSAGLLRNRRRCSITARRRRWSQPFSARDCGRWSAGRFTSRLTWTPLDRWGRAKHPDPRCSWWMLPRRVP